MEVQEAVYVSGDLQMVRHIYPEVTPGLCNKECFGISPFSADAGSIPAFVSLFGHLPIYLSQQTMRGSLPNARFRVRNALNRTNIGVR